jgi:hypothetical protein
VEHNEMKYKPAHVLIEKLCFAIWFSSSRSLYEGRSGLPADFILKTIERNWVYEVNALEF